MDKFTTHTPLEHLDGDLDGHVKVIEHSLTKLPAIGLDAGDKYCQLCVRDAAGDVASETRVRTTPEAIRKHFSTLVRCRVALEVGTHSRWIQAELTKLGFEVYVANARKLRAIYQSDTKTDKCDARFLAEVVQLKPSLLCPIKHRGEQAQADLALIRARAALVRTRTLLVNHVRTAVKSLGGRLAKTKASAFHKQSEAIPDERRLILEPLMKQIRELTAYIRGYDKTIEERVASYPEAAPLMKISGVGPQVALAFICTIEDPDRFRNVRKVGSYLGLRPRLDESGQIRKELGITKAGDGDVRRLLVSSAQYILGPFGPDTDLRRWGIKLVERGGQAAKKKAAVAVARKLAVLLLSLWKRGAEYEPLRGRTQPATAPTTTAAAAPAPIEEPPRELTTPAPIEQPREQVTSTPRRRPQATTKRRSSSA
jgi:transposase